MKTFLEKLEEDTKTHNPVVLAFGRMNPPTTGHEKLVDRVHQIAKDYNATHRIVVSHSVDAKKNPLDAPTKLKHVRRFFPGSNIIASSKEHPTFLQHAQALHQAGHDHLIMVAGSDRVSEYEEKLNKYNGEGPGKLFNFKKIEVKSAGQRDPDAEGTEGMSASKMREHAKNGDFHSFKQGIPQHVTEKHARDLFKDVRSGMGLHENVNRGLFKAIFVTGGPGSGKDIVIREAIAERRATELNLHQAMEYLMDKQKLSEKSNDLRRESIRNRGPLIINGPADDHSRIISVKEELEELGYDTMMVFVNTTNEVSKQRNENLSKSITESVRLEKWNVAQNNQRWFSDVFSRISKFDNSGLYESVEDEITKTYIKLNQFLDEKNYGDTAFQWLEKHGKLNINETFNYYFKEDINVKTNSRPVQQINVKGKPNYFLAAARPGDITPDSRAGDENADNIKWNANKRTGGYTFKTYTEEAPTLQHSEVPREPRFNQDKEKSKAKKTTVKPAASGAIRVTGIGPEFDTRQQGTVYAMSGMGDVTYREQKDFGSFRKTIKEYIDDSDSGLAGSMGGASNKEPMETLANNQSEAPVSLYKKKNKKGAK